MRRRDMPRPGSCCLAPLLTVLLASTASAFTLGGGVLPSSSPSSLSSGAATCLPSGPQRRARTGPSLARASATDEPIAEIIDRTKAAAVANTPFSDGEVAGVVASLQGVVGAGDVDWAALEELLRASAHQPHKDWARTKKAAEKLSQILGGPDDAFFRGMFKRVLEDGNWDGAAFAQLVGKPWVVLVCGVNGIRKTTSICQPWYKDVLYEALGGQVPKEELPVGANSFFRQLDYMIATMANEEFAKLYMIDEVGMYAARKDSIFARYRTVAEMLGGLLCMAAAERGLNVMVETSGRDVAMFDYIDHFFPDDQYRKLAVNFVINDVAFAERSVDARMLGEMAAGRAAVESGRPEHVIEANAGGPYGSQVLRGVQADSVRVWEGVVGVGGAGEGWYKASVRIDAAEGDWSVSAAGGGGAHKFV